MTSKAKRAPSRRAIAKPPPRMPRRLMMTAGSCFHRADVRADSFAHVGDQIVCAQRARRLAAWLVAYATWAEDRAEREGADAQAARRAGKP